MAFKTEAGILPDGAKYPSQTPAGMWKVEAGSPEYRAWAWWLARVFSKRFFPEPVMVVWFRWPPRTPEMADEIAARLSEIRDEIDKDPKWRRKCAAVTQHPEPWDGYIPAAPEPEKLIERDAMHAISKRLGRNFVAKKRERRALDQTPLSAVMRNRLGIDAPKPPEPEPVF